MESTTIIILLVLVLGAVLYIIFAKTRQERPEVQLVPPLLEPLPKPPAQYRRSIILPVGMGGSGKTTMARYLTGSPDATPWKRTQDFQIYRSSNKAEALLGNARGFVESETLVIDYMGQNASQLVSEMHKASNGQLGHTMEWGSVTCMVFVIDLVAPPDNEGDILHIIEYPQESRIKRQVDEWSELALDLLFGLATKDRLKLVCLFLNKADLLSAPDAKDEAKRLVEPLISRLQQKQRVNQFAYTTIIGSLGNGAGLNELRDLVNEHATVTV